MTAATVDTARDLSWVRLSGDDERCGIPDCGQEAVALAYFDETCEHIPDPLPLCIRHRDVHAGVLDRGLSLLRCCGSCGQSSKLLRVEPLRR